VEGREPGGWSSETDGQWFGRITDMDENPYQSPQSPLAEPKLGTWHPLTWAFIGFVGGNIVATPVVMIFEMPTTIFCGIIGALWGLSHGVERRRRDQR
jgi:hypothetical protein